MWPERKGEGGRKRERRRGDEGRRGRKRERDARRGGRERRSTNAMLFRDLGENLLEEEEGRKREKERGERKKKSSQNRFNAPVSQHIHRPKIRERVKE